MNALIPMIRDAAAGVFGRDPAPERGREAAKGFGPLLASKLSPRKEAERTAPTVHEPAENTTASESETSLEAAEAERRSETERSEQADATRDAEAGAESEARSEAVGSRERDAAEANAERAARDGGKPATGGGESRKGETDPAKTAVVTEVGVAASEEATPGPGEVRRADPNRVYRGLDRLEGEFRSRFERVVARMQEEFGHKVEVVETFRDQARQELLFQQGRSQPGQVVTWTRNSNHSRGTAADVMIDGSYDSQLAFTRLAQIAAEEGLRTLGPKDPGHLELPAAGAGAQPVPGPAATPAQRRVGLAVPAVPQMAQVTQVARVAEIAVPTVARVAQVAQPGSSTAAASPVASASAAVALEVELPAAPAPLEIKLDLGGETRTTAATSTAAGGEALNFGGSRSGSSDTSGERKGGDETSARAQALQSSTEASMLAELAAADPTQSLRAPQGISSVEAAVPVSGVDTASRIARVLDVQESLGALTPTSMLLRVENASGVEDRIRVDLRGNRVDATLNLGNPGEVGALGARVEDLVRALERHGLETDSVRIRSAASLSDNVELGRAAAALADSDTLRTAAARSGAESSLSRDGGDGGHPSPRDDQRPRPDADSQQRSRKQPKGEKPS